MKFQVFIPFALLSRQFQTHFESDDEGAASFRQFVLRQRPTDKDKPLDKIHRRPRFPFPVLSVRQGQGRAYRKYWDCLSFEAVRIVCVYVCVYVCVLASFFSLFFSLYASFFPIGMSLVSIRPLLSCEASRPALPYCPTEYFVLPSTIFSRLGHTRVHIIIPFFDSPIPNLLQMTRILLFCSGPGQTRTVHSGPQPSRTFPNSSSEKTV